MKTLDLEIPVMGRLLAPDDPHGFSSLAKDYLKAAIVLNANFKNVPEWPTFSCTCQSLELYLKAFLRAKNVPTAELKNPKIFGHDLQMGFDKARGLGLDKTFELIDELGKYVPLISRPHKERDFHYRKSGGWELPFLSIVISLVEKLGQKVDY